MPNPPTRPSEHVRYRVLTPEQYREGYYIHPHVRLGARKIEAEHRYWPPAVGRTPEGNYIVMDRRA